MQVPAVSPDWWRSLFDEVYLETDARSVLDDEVTRREVEGVIGALDLRPGELVLDLCGGQGRHALDLAWRGYGRVLVLDFSQPLLSLGSSQARQRHLPVTFIRGDARSIPLAGGNFGVVLCLANSFGYGATRQEDVQILKEAARLLKPEGRLFLEVADPEFVRRHLPPQSWHEASADLVVCRQRWLTGEALVCREVVLSRSRGLVRDGTYQMRLYSPDALKASLSEAGFSRVRLAPQAGSGPPSGDRGSLSRRLAVIAWK